MLAEEGVEGWARFVFHHNAAGQEAVADGILGRTAFSFGGSGSKGAGAVGARG
jgi:hypothetical protein